MRTHILLLSASFFSLCASAQVSEIDSIRNQFEAEARQTVEDFEAYSQQAYEDYMAYERQARQEFEAYVNSINAVWGDTLTDTQKEWVSYSDDRSERSVVDFETGRIDVEVALDEGASEEEVKSRLQQAVEQLLNNRGTTCPYKSEVDASNPIAKQPILEGLLDLTPYELPTDDMVEAKPKRKAPPTPVVKGKDLPTYTADKVVAQPKKDKTQPTSTLADRKAQAKEKAAEKIARWTQSTAEIAKRIVEKTVATVKTITGGDGKERKVAKVEMALVKDNISKNAALYKDLVAEFSARFQVEQPLIYAIMEQESAFNPQAKSWVPAYGLMQLVPKSGGRDAYRYVYKTDRICESSYLFDPRNNIELGTAYLRVLLNQFGKVEDAGCRQLCVIAAYNTGAGNVSRCFIGSTKLANAFPTINQLDYTRLYNHLISELPYEETRNYVKKVVQRREKYLK
ncbi:MAG: DUF3393 domain-containing protein [Bacteroidaceae bacterium]|nr:DUF3393 domain-containing protein [Bacteroidaceae bacterium]